MSSIWKYLAKQENKQPSELWKYFSCLNAPNSKTANSVESQPCAEAFDEQFVYWALRNIPAREAVKHFLIMGATGSGKTTAIDLFLQSIAPRFHRDREVKEQLIIFDAKSDIIPKLARLGFWVKGTEEARVAKEKNANFNGDIWLLNPYDSRTHGWNIAHAVQSPMMARHVAALLVPEEKGSSAPFFWTASRELVFATILGLNRVADCKWDLRDLLCALESAQHIRAVASRDPRGKAIASRILDDERHAAGVVSSLATKIAQFEQVAALWQSVAQFSIPDFLESSGVLVLGNDPVLRESIWPINALVLKSLSMEILRRPNTNSPRHWFLLDEFSAMERVECIHELLNRGRSKGASVLLGLQGIDKLNELYGPHAANDLLEQCANKTFLRAGGPATAEWIERFFGRYREMEAVHSESWSWGAGQNQSSRSIQYQLAERSLFTGSYFMDLPFTGPGLAYTAVSDVPCLDCTLISEREFDHLPRRSGSEDIPNVIPSDDPNEQRLEPWTLDELNEFCGPDFNEAKDEDINLPTRGERWPDDPDQS